MKCTHVCAAQTTYQLCTKKKNNPISLPSPDMNIKVTAFTVTKKLYYTCTKFDATIYATFMVCQFSSVIMPAYE